MSIVVQVILCICAVVGWLTLLNIDSNLANLAKILTQRRR